MNTRQDYHPIKLSENELRTIGAFGWDINKKRRWQIFFMDRELKAHKLGKIVTGSINDIHELAHERLSKKNIIILSMEHLFFESLGLAESEIL
jgi:hypothetical protein